MPISLIRKCVDLPRRVAYPVAVFEGGEDEKTNPWTVDYSSLTPLLVKGIQDQQQIIEQLTIDNKNQETRIKELEAQVTKINQLETMLLKMQAQLDTTTNSNQTTR